MANVMPSKEERFRLFLFATMAVGCRDQFFGLGYGQCGEEVGKHGAQRAAQPDIEEVRKVSIANVVVVRWVGGDDHYLVLKVWLAALALRAAQLMARYATMHLKRVLLRPCLDLYVSILFSSPGATKRGLSSA